MNTTALLLGAFTAMMATVAGSSAVFAVKRMPTTVLPVIASFCAGMMALAAFEMLTESHALAGHGSALAGLAVGTAVLLLLEKLLPHVHVLFSKEALPADKKKVALLAGTITLHNIPEGFAIASAFAASPSLGWLVTISIALQDIPEGAMVSIPAACYGMSARKCFLCGVLSGLAEFLAAVVAFFFLRTSMAAMPFALGFSSGAMFYVVFFELLPDVMQAEIRRRSAAAFILGILTAFLVGMLVGG